MPGEPVTVVAVEWHGTNAITLTYRTDPDGPTPSCSTATTRRGSTIEEAGAALAFDGDGTLFRLVSEAKRIRLAYLFDPFLAVHTSNLEPLPHQIEAVYEEMLPRQPLRFLLADDPGAGKTIMAGPVHQGADHPRRRRALPDRRARQPRRAVAGRAVAEVRPGLRDPHRRDDRGLRRPATRSPRRTC